MGTFLIILLVAYLIWFLFREPIMRWVRGYMQRRTEDMMRRMMGMPSRKEERRRQKEAQRKGARHGAEGRKSRSAKPPVIHPAQAMKSVAEDVEFTEIKEFESTVVVEDDGQNTRIFVEEQITDAEYVEIKDPLRK